jgi:hypothetical protein
MLVPSFLSVQATFFFQFSFAFPPVCPVFLPFVLAVEPGHVRPPEILAKSHVGKVCPNFWFLCHESAPALTGAFTSF